MSESLSLLNNSSDEDSGDELKINENYAKRYNVWREKEEFQKLKDLSKEISESSSESEEEVEPVIEKDFLKTLSLLKSKDPRIYDEKVEFFTEEPIVVKKPKEKKEKPMFMKDYERSLVLERNGVFSDEEEESMASKAPITFREQAEIKKSFKEALADSDGDDDDLLQVRSKTNAEKEKEEEDYKQWLETEKDMLHLNRYWNDPELNEKEKFLRDYILNKRYVVDDNEDHIPTYDEITEDIGNLIEDEKTIEQQELFEHKYNFRFEEPDEEFIKTYPRTIGDSLRRTDTKRKQKREEYAERKKKEKEQKREELKRLKALKRKEIEEKFLKLKEASGQDELNFDEIDIESDFDPDKHDQKMKEMFNDDYYNVEEEQKPEFDFDEEIDNEDWDHWTREQIKHQKNKKSYNEERDDEGEESSGEEDDNPKHDSRAEFEQEIIESMSKKKKGRKKSLFAKILSEPKPLYDPDGKSFEEYLDEYYRLDYEDIVGDMPVRFKYRKVIPNDFGLTVDEILAAHDKELNRWCSVKKTCQYRRDDEEKYDIQAFQKKAQNSEAKKKILNSVYSQPEGTEKKPAKTTESDETAAKKKRKKKRQKKKKSDGNTEDMKKDSNLDDEVLPDAEVECPETVVESTQESKRKKKKKKKSGKISNNLSAENGEVNDELDLDNSRNENGLAEENKQQNPLLIDEFNHNGNDKKITKNKKKIKTKMNASEETDLLSNSDGNKEDERNQNEIESNKISKKRKLDSLEESDSFANFSNVEPVDDVSEFKDSQNKFKKNKKKKRDSTEKADSLSKEELNNSPTKKSQRDFEDKNSKSHQPFNKSFKNQNRTFSNPHTRNFERNNSFNCKFKNRNKKFNNDEQPFKGPFSHKQKFHNSDFRSGNKAQKSYGSEQVLNCSGKKIVSSNTRLGAFQINPKKLKNKMMYGKKKF